MRSVIAFVFFLLSQPLMAAVTINDQSINFGSVPFSSAVGQAQIPFTVTINCTSGSTLKIEPNAGSNGFIQVNMTREGLANGTQYVYFLNTGGVLMKSSTPASLINTTCTGANQVFNLTAVLSGTTTAGTLVLLNRTGVISFTGKFLKVTVAGVANFSSNQTVGGSVDANCSPSIGNMSYGVIPASGTTNVQQVTTYLRATCDNGVPYTIAGDTDSSTWIYNSGLCADLFSPPQPSSPAIVCLKIRPSGNLNWNNLGITNNLFSGVGTGAEQGYEIRADVTIPPNATGILHKVINLKMVF